MTPLDVLISVMKKHWDADRWNDAASAAAKAAPYVHAKVMQPAMGDGLEQLTDAQIDELYAATAFAEGEGTATSPTD